MCGIIFLGDDMMLKEYLKSRKITTYRFAKDIYEPYSTINDIVNGKKDIADCPAIILKKMSNYLDLSMEEVYSLCDLSFSIFSEKYNVSGNIYVKSKSYNLSFDYKNHIYDMKICKVTEISSEFIEELTLYKMEKIIKEIIWEEYLWNM